MKKNLTELVFILDRSGSMAGLEQDTIGGFNAMIEKQKKEPGEALVSTFLFNNRSTLVHDRMNVRNVAPMTERDYFVGGGTALLDAVGHAIRHIALIHRYAREEDRPEKTVFVITTDGMENASRKDTYPEVREMIAHEKEKYGWEFLFLGANIDAAAEAARFGIDEMYTANYHADAAGTAAVYETVNDAIHMVRNKGAVTSVWKEKVSKDYTGRT